MSIAGVGGYGSGYRQKYVEILLNAGTRVLTFDNWEVTDDIQFGESHYPEIFNSAMGYATKVSARQPMMWKVAFNLTYPSTIGKLNDLIAFTRDRYQMEVRIWGAREWPAASTQFVTPAYYNMEAIVEWPRDLSWRHQSRGQGINKEQKPEFRFYETLPLVLPEKSDLSGGLVLAGDGSTIVLNASTLTATGVPKTNFLSTGASTT